MTPKYLPAVFLLTLAACTGEIYEQGADFDPNCDDGHCDISILSANRSSHATKIRDSSAVMGMTNGALLAGIGEVETNLTHCWSEATWACKGPPSPSCGGRPVIAGSADGACWKKKGGLGMFQFDRGTHSQTVSYYGSDIVTLEGNVNAVIPFLLVRAVESVPGINSQQQALDWMNSIRIADGNPDFEKWVRFVSWRFNGCKGCTSQENKYRRATHKVAREFGNSFWDVDSGSSTPDPTPTPEPTPDPDPTPTPNPTYGSCSAAGLQGECIDTNASSCGGQLYSGHCAGGNNIRCCVDSQNTDWGVCEAFGQAGDCIDTSVQSCGGSTYSGFCPGSSSIRCCTQ